MTNGTLSPSASDRGEVDASTHSAAPHPQTLQPQSLQQVCADVHSRINAFLAVLEEDETIKSTQEQTRIAMGVIEQALEEYQCVLHPVFSTKLFNLLGW